MRLAFIVLILCCFVWVDVAEADSATQNKDVEMEAVNLFWKSNFTELEKRFSTYRDSKSRASDGSWMLNIFYNGLASLVSPKFSDEKSWNSVFQRAEDWINLYPNSPSAHIVKANFLHLYAWKFRGEDPGAKPTAPYIENLQKAIDYLQSTKKISGQDPEWYARMVLLLKDLNVEEGRVQKQIGEASRRFPEYGPIYLNAIDYFLPRWHGDMNKIEAFANAVAELTRASDGMGMFVHVYWTVSKLTGDRGALFQSFELDWSKIKQGMRDIVKKHPDPWNINNFAYFSCLAQDRLLTKEFINLVDTPIHSVWGENFQHCRKFAGMNDEISLREDIGREATRLFWRGDFEKLDEMANSYRQKQSKTASGVWKLSTFHRGIAAILYNRPDSAEQWSRVFQISDEWVKSRPESSAAHIVKAAILSSYGAKLRGSGWASEVSKKGMELFKQYNEQAREYLLATKEVSSQDPHWYSLMLTIEKNLGIEERLFRRTLQEGMERYPSYYETYFSAVIYFLPRWHGSKRHVEEFANAAAEHTRDIEGTGLYSRIYWYAGSYTGRGTFFKDYDVNWEKMKQGFHDIIKKYPSQWNINNFAFVACMAQDRAMTKELLQKVQTPSPFVWEGLFETCKQFAMQE